jgi:hypothetical protein
MVKQRELIHTPKGAEFLSVGVQDGIPCVWALVKDIDAPPVTRVIRIATTGEVFNAEGCVFIGSMQMGTPTWFVAHVFEQIGKHPDPLEPRFNNDFNDIQEEVRKGTA